MSPPSCGLSWPSIWFLHPPWFLAWCQIWIQKSGPRLHGSAGMEMCSVCFLSKRKMKGQIALWSSISGLKTAAANVYFGSIGRMKCQTRFFDCDSTCRTQMWQFKMYKFRLHDCDLPVTWGGRGNGRCFNICKRHITSPYLIFLHSLFVTTAQVCKDDLFLTKFFFLCLNVDHKHSTVTTLYWIFSLKKLANIKFI